MAGRHSKRIILLEGKRLVNEAIQTQQDLKSVFFTHTDVLQGLPVDLLAAQGVKLYRVNPNHMKVWSDTVTPQGIMAICKLPKTSGERSSDKKLLPITVVCDNIQDPGMLGTLLRSAVAARCSKILVTRGCVDAWEPKVLRSGAGAHFHAPSLVTGLSWELAVNYVPTNGQVFLVAQQSTSANCQNPDNGNPVHSQKQDVSASAEFCSSRPTTAEIPYISLDTVDCATTDVTVVVSELTSSDATQFILERKGYQLLLPMDRSIGLLNAAVSGSITLFELVRQMRRKTSI